LTPGTIVRLSIAAEACAVCEGIRFGERLPDNRRIAPGDGVRGNVAANDGIRSYRAVSADPDSLLHKALRRDPHILADGDRAAFHVFGIVSVPGVYAVEVVVEYPAFGQNALRSDIDPFLAPQPGTVQEGPVADPNDGIRGIRIRSNEHPDINVVTDYDSPGPADLQSPAEHQIAADLNTRTEEAAPQCEQSAFNAPTRGTNGATRISERTMEF
jgi:hypothetical protein